MSSRLTPSQEIEITRRIRVDYDIIEQKTLQYDKKITLLQIEKKSLTGQSIIHENQEECSLTIVAHLQNKKIINIMVVALTQSGKTGTMSALIKNYLNHSSNLIPIENIYIITALSSREWVAQTKNRMPDSIQQRVFHRSNLTRQFINDIKNKKNVLIIIDEIQIAAKENQSLNKAFSEAGLYDKQTLLKNDIKIVEFTATPDGTIYDLMDWGDNALHMQMQPGDGYTSCFDLKNQGRVLPYKDLCGYNKRIDKVNKELVSKNINELVTVINKYKKPKYHILRIPNAYKGDIVIENLKEFINENIKYHIYDKGSDIEDINKILEIPPEQDEYIFIKEKLRCAKTLYKKHLGVLYERFTNSPDDAVIIQGLIGRGTGYDDNGETIVFTNIISINKYEKLWNSNFEDKSIQWKSKTTKKWRNGGLKSTDTFNSAKYIEGMNSSSGETKFEECEPIIKKYRNFDEAKKYIKEDLGHKRGPNKLSEKYFNSDGFYENIIRSKRKVMSLEDVINERKSGLTTNIEKKSYRLHVCYEDLNDKTSIQYWVIHY